VRCLAVWRAISPSPALRGGPKRRYNPVRGLARCPCACSALAEGFGRSGWRSGGVECETRGLIASGERAPRMWCWRLTWIRLIACFGEALVSAPSACVCPSPFVLGGVKWLSRLLAVWKGCGESAVRCLFDPVANWFNVRESLPMHPGLELDPAVGGGSFDAGSFGHAWAWLAHR